MQGAGDAPAPGVVELREDAPLKARAGAGAGAGAGDARWCADGPRLIAACFGALTAAITLALVTQIYYGDYEVVPHGSVASSGAACSRAGTDALKAGGRAADAAVAAALCLAVTAPHRTSLDASGSLLYWEYRQLRTQQPILMEWGGAASDAASDAAGEARAPRLLRALAALHAQYGVLPWPLLLQPAVQLARDGFPVSASLARALAEAAGGSGSPPASPASPASPALSTAPRLAAFLETLQHNTSAELTAAWGAVPWTQPAPAAVGGARLWAGGAGAARAQRACARALAPPPAGLDDAQARVVEALMADVTAANATDGGGVTNASGGVATGLAVVDHLDTYLALVTGLSVPFGSGATPSGADAGADPGAGGWTRDLPTAELDLAPAIMADQQVCGSRYVLGAESGAALAQVCAALGAGGGPAAVERARGGGAPDAAVNLVQQVRDTLLSHADSRGGGLASRF